MYCDQRVYVCLFVCLSVRLHISKTTRSNFNEFSVHVACHHDSIVLWQQCNIYVLPVLWMTPCFHIMEPNRSESKTTRMFCSVRQLAAPRVKYAVFDCMLLNAEKRLDRSKFRPFQVAARCDRTTWLSVHRRSCCCSAADKISWLNLQDWTMADEVPVCSVDS